MVKKKVSDNRAQVPSKPRGDSWKVRPIRYDPDMNIEDKIALKAEAAWWCG